MLKSVVRAVGAAARLSSASTSAARVLPLSYPALRSPSSAITRPFTRSLWMLSNNGASSGYRPKLFSSKVLSPSVSCGCGGLHTEGDVWFNLLYTSQAANKRNIRWIRQLGLLGSTRPLQFKGVKRLFNDRYRLRSASSESFTLNCDQWLSLKKALNLPIVFDHSAHVTRVGLFIVSNENFLDSHKADVSFSAVLPAPVCCVKC